MRAVSSTPGRFGQGAELAGAAAWLATVLIATFSTTPLTYDEPAYLAPVAAFQQYGWSFDLLAKYPEVTGIVHTAIQWVAAPATGLAEPGVRIVTSLVAGLALAATGALLETVSSGSSLFALRLMALPPMWIISGMALTEAPAVALLALALMIFFRSTIAATTRRSIALAVLAGVVFTLAVLSKQAVLATCTGMLWLAYEYPQWRRPTAIAGIVAAGLLAPVFAAWGGVAPPLATLLQRGNTFSLQHAAYAFGYAGLMGMVLSYGFFVIDRRSAALAAAIGLAISIMLGWQARPLNSVAARIIGTSALPIYGYACAALIVGMGCLFIVSMARRARTNHDPRWRASAVSLLAAIGALGAVTYSFSGRYLIALAPLLAVVLHPYRRYDTMSACLLIVGYLCGAVSLLTYLRW